MKMSNSKPAAKKPAAKMNMGGAAMKKKPMGYNKGGTNTNIFDNTKDKPKEPKKPVPKTSSDFGGTPIRALIRYLGNRTEKNQFSKDSAAYKNALEAFNKFHKD